MRIFKIFAAIIAIGLFIVACNDEQVIQPPAPIAQTLTTDDYWAKDNFDLSRIGPLLERSDNVEEFEGYLNEPNGINNIDFNGDGYVDYLSVREFGDDYDDQHGLSLYCNYGDDLIQDIATVYFYRDEPTYPGSRILIYGDDRLYGDNYYYETNWLDRAFSLATYLFADHDLYYSPYYYDYYPPSYVVYEVVDTPIYVTRITRLYPNPVFVYTTAPTYISSIDIRSPYEDRYIGQINARLVKPTNEQAQFIANNPRKIGQLKPDRSGRPDTGDGRGVGGPAQGEPDRPAQPGRPEQPGRADRPERPVEPGRPDRPERPADRPAPARRTERPARPERPAPRTERPARSDRPAPRTESPARPAPRTERPAAPRLERPARPQPARPQPQPRQQPTRSQPQPSQQAPARPQPQPRKQAPAKPEAARPQPQPKQQPAKSQPRRGKP